MAMVPQTAFGFTGTLAGPNFRLEPFREAHREGLRRAAEADQSIWTYFPMQFNGAGVRFDAWFDHALAQREAGQHYPFAVRHIGNDSIIGTTRYYDLAPLHRRLALGSTWYIREARGT